MYDPRKLTPKWDWSLLLADERKDALSSGIILPGSETGSERVTELAGEIIRIGPGKLNDFMRRQGLEEGCRVVFRGFLKYAHPLETDETWPSGKAKEFFFIDSNDIMGIVSPGVEVGVFSGRPMVPHVQRKEST